MLWLHIVLRVTIDFFKHVYLLSVLMLCAPVFIFTSGNSFTSPTLWFIDLTVATCHIQYTLLSLCQFV